MIQAGLENNFHNLSKITDRETSITTTRNLAGRDERESSIFGENVKPTAGIRKAISYFHGSTKDGKVVRAIIRVGVKISIRWQSAIVRLDASARARVRAHAAVCAALLVVVRYSHTNSSQRARLPL